MLLSCLSPRGTGTQTCTPVVIEMSGSKILMIDTPGFEDSARPNWDILDDISRTLVAQHLFDVQLKGIIYIQPITDDRVTGGQTTTFEIMQRICGLRAFESVLLVTSRWSSTQRSEDKQFKKEGVLMNKYWAKMLAAGATMSRFYDSTDSAIALVSQLLRQESVVVDLQRELMGGQQTLKKTQAGEYVMKTDNRKASRSHDVRSEVEKALKTLAPNWKVAVARGVPFVVCFTQFLLSLLGVPVPWAIC